MREPAVPPAAAARPQHEDAYVKLRDAIVACRLEPGAHVTEGELAESYGFGKASVRVALVRLSQEGLVRPLGRRGYEIAPITFGDVEELFDVRAMLEGESARLAAGRIDVERLVAIERRLQEGVNNDPQLVGSAEANALHAGLHLNIAAATGNQRLLAMMQSTMRETSRLLHLGLGLLPARQIELVAHAELIDALARGDAAAAETAARTHVAAGRDMVMRALLQSPGMRHIALPGRRIA